MKRLLSFGSALSATAAVMSLILAMALTTNGALYRSQTPPPSNNGCADLLCGDPNIEFKTCDGGQCEQSPFCGCLYDPDCTFPNGDVGVCCICIAG